MIMALVLAPVVMSKAADAQNFDGEWQTTVSCAAARDALGYSFRFMSTVKNGTFHGVQGTVGQPSSLQIDGKIAPDGTANLYVNGRTGSKEMVPGRDTPRGTERLHSPPTLSVLREPEPVSRGVPAPFNSQNRSELSASNCCQNEAGDPARQVDLLIRTRGLSRTNAHGRAGIRNVGQRFARASTGCKARNPYRCGPVICVAGGAVSTYDNV